LDAYTEGVNSGLAALGQKPFEYVLLRLDPAPWRSEDSMLAVFAMCFVLNDERGRRESTRGLLHDVLPKELAEFLAPPGTEWDAPVVGEIYGTPPIPGPDVYDLRQQATDKAADARVPLMKRQCWGQTPNVNGVTFLPTNVNVGVRP
jgi:penicillin amidase